MKICYKGNTSTHIHSFLVQWDNSTLKSQFNDAISLYYATWVIPAGELRKSYAHSKFAFMEMDDDDDDLPFPSPFPFSLLCFLFLFLPSTATPILSTCKFVISVSYTICFTLKLCKSLEVKEFGKIMLYL